MYWNVCPSDGLTYMYEVDLSTGQAQLLYQLEDGDEIMGMFIPAPAAEDGAPAECENVTLNFSGSSLSGKVSLKAPSTLFDGTAASGELTINVLANGEQLGTVAAEWGAEVEIPVDLSSKGAGSYEFTIFASNGVGDGPKTKIKNVWVGADTPQATTATLAYVNGNMEISWQPVTASVNGGYLDLDKLTYTVKDMAGAVVAQGLTETSYTKPVAEPETLTQYFYTVEAVCDGLVSEPAQTNTVVIGSIVPPYVSDFINDGILGWTLIDGNEDRLTWKVQSEGCVRIQYNGGVDMDDWLITPPIKLEAGKSYEVSYETKCYGSSYPERLEVKYGRSNSAESMTEVILAPTDILNDEYETYTYTLAPAEDGLYYIGFHGISKKDQYYLYLNNIKIAAGMAQLAPGLVTNLAATPDPIGAEKCTVSFDAPDKNYKGDALESLTKIDVFRGEELVKTFSSPAIGASLSFVDEMETGGDVTYTVVASNESGEGPKATVSAFVGFAEPASVSVADVARTDVEGQVVVTWEPVTTDINGLTLPEGAVSYLLCTYTDRKWVPFAEGVMGTSYTYQAAEAGTQKFVQVGVFAQTDHGIGYGAVTEMIPVGTPYPGISESFADSELKYIWGMSADEDATVMLADDHYFSDIKSYDGDNGFLMMHGYTDCSASVMTGIVSLEGIENPALTFYTYNVVDSDGVPDDNEISVSVSEIGSDSWTEVMAPAKVNDLCSGYTKEWGKVTVPLEAYAGKTIQVKITGMARFYSYTMLDNINIGSVIGNDLKVSSFDVPEKVNCGEDYKVSVRVANDGLHDAEAFSVELYADNEVMATKMVEKLVSSASTDVVFDLNMSAIATEPIRYYAYVIFDDDENESNNMSSSLEVAPVVSNLPAVTDLEGTSDDGTVTLTWSKPNLEDIIPQEVTDDFEDGEPFAAEYGDWTFVDVDQCEVSGFQNTDIPGINPGETKGSFWIWDQKSIDANSTCDGHSGDKYLFSLFRWDNEATDDWAISPELTGEAQTVSFWARSYLSDYPEAITVYYSTGSKELSDFIVVEGADVPSVPGNWTQYNIELPEGAKYFAINSHASGVMLMVDDVTYTPANRFANLEVAGYNVYRDAAKITEIPVSECTYTDSNVSNGEKHKYVVTTVYNGMGESKASNEVELVTSGVDTVGNDAISIKAIDNKVIVLNAEGRNITVVAANGCDVYSGVGKAKIEITLAGGVYVVKAGDKVVKVIVK